MSLVFKFLLSMMGRSDSSLTSDSGLSAARSKTMMSGGSWKSSKRSNRATSHDSEDAVEEDGEMEAQVLEVRTGSSVSAPSVSDGVFLRGRKRFGGKSFTFRFKDGSRREYKRVEEVGVAMEANLLDIDDFNETFMVEMIVHIHFNCKSPNASAADEFRRLELDDYRGILPNIVITASVGIPEFIKGIRVNDHTGDAFVSYQGTVTISEPLELEQMPFDRQILPIRIKIPGMTIVPWKLETDVLDFYPRITPRGGLAPSNARYQVSCFLNKWRLREMDAGIHTGDPDPVALSSCGFELSLLVERDPRSSFWRNVPPLYLIVLLNASASSISVLDVSGRLQISTALFLTAVAFKAQTPDVGYSTYYDVYSLLGFIFISIGVVFNIVIAPSSACLAEYFSGEPDNIIRVNVEQCLIDNELGNARIDAMFQLGYVSLWTLLNIAVVIVTYFPDCMRYSWEHVINNQIGITPKTYKQVRLVKDLDNDDNAIFQDEVVTRDPHE